MLILFDPVNSVLQIYNKEIIKDRQEDLSARIPIIVLFVKSFNLKIM